jgi:hypothetical protein
MHAAGIAKERPISVLVSTKQAATILGCTTGRVRQLRLEDKLRGIQITNNAWLFDRRDIERYARANPRVRGRPRIAEVA